MEIKKKIVVPTGEIYTAIGEKGMLEFLTVGDYGKNANIKADFLGITRDLNGVPNGEPMPLTEKWVITISTQYGCSMGCKFCDVPKVGIGRNATFNDLKGEVLTAIKQHPEVKHTKRLNIHYARMGEPTWNANVLLHAISVKKDIEPFIGDSLVHPVISTMLPKRNKKLVEFLHKWCYYIKNELYKGDAGLQFSINTTIMFYAVCFKVNIFSASGDSNIPSGFVPSFTNLLETFNNFYSLSKVCFCIFDILLCKEHSFLNKVVLDFAISFYINETEH